MLLSYRSWIVKFKFQSCGQHLFVAGKARIVTGGGNIVVGDNFIMDEFAEICCNPIENKTDCQPKLIIGNNVHLSKHCCIGCSNMIVLENDVRLAPYCHITDRNHVYKDIYTPIWKQPTESPGPVVIGEQTWLGFGVQVMPNVKIGKHCVVAAGSIVTKDIPDYSVVTGIPAKVIKRYNFEKSIWEKV